MEPELKEDPLIVTEYKLVKNVSDKISLPKTYRKILYLYLLLMILLYFLV
jgi:hypothetical protein